MSSVGRGCGVDAVSPESHATAAICVRSGNAARDSAWNGHSFCVCQWGTGMKRALLGAIAAAALAGAEPGRAADNSPALPTKAPAAPRPYDWTGFHVGAHAGWGLSGLGIAADPTPGTGWRAFRSSGLSGGFHGGHNHQFSNNIVAGIEADITFADYFGLRAATGTSTYLANLQYFGTFRGRVGYALDRFLPYATAGFAWGQNKVNIDNGNGVEPTRTLAHVGWSAGAGVEYAIDNTWTARAEYSYVDLGWKTYNSLFFDSAT